MIEAIEQLFKVTMGVILVVGWMGIALVACGLAILIFRIIKRILEYIPNQQPEGKGYGQEKD